MTQTHAVEARNRSFRTTVLISAALGAVLGVFFTSTWQVAVETAQVLAGTVVYPPENPFYRYHVSAWSLLHQLLSVPLRFGADERVLSIILSGVLTALTFSGISICAHAICRRATASIVAPLLWFALFQNSNAYGVVYPLVLAGTHHTYGILGRAGALWLVGLAAHRHLRSAALLFALLPALHLTWGAYACLIAAIGCVGNRSVRTELTKVWPSLLAGIGVCITSFVLQRIWSNDLPAVHPSDTGPVLDAFLTYWDGHRVPTSILVPGTLLVIAVAACAVVLLLNPTQRPEESMMFSFAALAGFSGVAVLVLAQFPQWLPTTVSMAMPGRFANFALLLFPALLLGIIGRLQTPLRAALLLGIAMYALGNGLFLMFLSSDKYGWSLPHWAFLTPALVAVTLLIRRVPKSAATSRNWTSVGEWAAVIVVAVIVFAFPKGRIEPLLFTPEDPVIVQAKEGSGLIVTGPGLELMQLQTRRPILLNTGGLDQLPYVPESGPAMEEMLESVYGVSIVNPPPAVRERRVGALPFGMSIDLFANRSIPEWQQIAGKFAGGGPLSVLVRPSHELAMDPAAESDDWRLYDISASYQEP